MSTQTASSDAPPASAAKEMPGRTLTLIAVLLAVFVVPMSISGTAVALPDIGASTHAGLAPLQWVVNAFNVAFACFTLVWGSVADIIGRVKAFAMRRRDLRRRLARQRLRHRCAVARRRPRPRRNRWRGHLLLRRRDRLHHLRRARLAKAFAYFGTVAGVGVALGPSLSGALVQTLGWRWVFAVHAIALVVVLLAVPAISKAVPATGSTGARIDFAGSGLFVVAMVLLTTAIVQGSQWGWGSVGVVALFAGALVVLAVFAYVENRREHPMLDLSVLRNRRFVGLCLVPVSQAPSASSPC